MSVTVDGGWDVIVREVWVWTRGTFGWTNAKETSEPHKPQTVSCLYVSDPSSRRRIETGKE